jgi:DNA helicase II / ATP-dependent DNA helicase PcrA
MTKKNLNNEQELAVNGDGNLFVLAGAGTGKTSVLTHRVVRLLESGVPLNKIMAVTFTNKAAKEMKGRLQDMTHHSLSGAWIGTFHGLCHRVLRQYWAEANLTQGFTIMSDTDQLALIKRTILNEGADAKDEDPKGIQTFINKEKDKGLRAKDIAAQPKNFDKARLKKWYELYQIRCEKEGVVDFAELMLRVFELWRDNSSIRKRMQSQFQHILVDEFQDTNALQYLWLNMLKSAENNIFAVGDDAQSIYGFRGAMIENVQKFITEHNATLIKLEQNYRSTKPILELANSVIGHSDTLIAKKLFTQ